MIKVCENFGDTIIVMVPIIYSQRVDKIVARCPLKNLQAARMVSINL